ncbi:hypothetical protein [Frankia canadensis]|uniref:hypothetical protein n=1 Tax=Frankia canadensis TaxID=1836972 RepID=UPI0010543B28|nr:hypothetical protein [Frankia canadensis]
MEVQILIDGQPYPLPAGTDPEELRRRVAQAVFRCEVEQLHLADGRTMLVNWRSVRLVEIRQAGGASAPTRDRQPAAPATIPPPPPASGPNKDDLS